jgi:hypothetical protein
MLLALSNGDSGAIDGEAAADVDGMDIDDLVRQTLETTEEA